jgi:amidohydrolase
MLDSAEKFTVTITGKEVHAAHPHKGIDPIVVGTYIITELQTIVSRRVAPIDAAVVSIGHLTAGTISILSPQNASWRGRFAPRIPRHGKRSRSTSKI